MAKTFIIHGGNLKTGSTAIQNFLRSNLGRVETECDMAVPALELTTSIHAALAVDANRHERHAEFNWSNLPDWIGRKPQSSVLLTSEVFIRTDPQDFKARLADLAPQSVDLYFYLRPHIQMLTSSLAQAYKIGHFPEALADGAVRMSKSIQVDFQKQVEKFFAVFGEDRVHCREYAREFFPNGDVVQDFGDFIGKPQLSRIAVEVAETERNVAPGTEELALAHWLRSTMPTSLPTPVYMTARRWIFASLLQAFANTIPRDHVTRFVLPLEIQQATKERFEARRIAFSGRLEGFRTSKEWMDETIRPPQEPNNIPLPKVKNALARVLNKLPPGAAQMRDLVDNAVAQIPFTTEKGVKVVPIRDLPFFGGK